MTAMVGWMMSTVRMRDGDGSGDDEGEDGTEDGDELESAVVTKRVDGRSRAVARTMASVSSCVLVVPVTHPYERKLRGPVFFTCNTDAAARHVGSVLSVMESVKGRDASGLECGVPAFYPRRPAALADPLPAPACTAPTAHAILSAELPSSPRDFPQIE